jgi:hypothetical protein
MAVAEEDSSLFNEDDQEKWILVNLHASFSDAVSSKDCTLTATVPLLNCTECSFLLCFLFGNLGSSCCSFKDV